MRLLLTLLMLFGIHCADAAPIPTPKTDINAEGVFVINRLTMVSHADGLKSLAQYIGEYIPIRSISPAMSSGNTIALVVDSTLGDEEYRLDIRPSHIGITGGGYGGVFNGIQTLFSLMPASVYAKQLPENVSLNSRTICDTPRFSYRGMMLDVTRTWIDADNVKRYIDLLSYHKINKLHIHLSDDEGWRIEIKSHPELAEIGGFRGGDSPVKAVYGKWALKYGGYYTQEQMKDIIAYAAVRNIEVIPEIDLPGHSRNIASVRPEIRCNYTPDLSASNGYDYRSAWCVAKESNYKLLADIFAEICDLFPSKYIHIGGDEVELSQWDRCPDCTALKKRKGMTDGHQLQYYFTERLTTMLEEKGKMPAVWNESIKGGELTHNSLVYGWQNTKACKEAMSKGYNTVVMPAQYFYIDMRQSPNEEGHSWAAIFDAETTYSFDFAKQGFTDDQLKYAEGIEAAFWSEIYVSHNPETTDYIDYLCFPRICAVAELAWNGRGGDWPTFKTRLVDEHYDRMAAMGIKFRLFPPTVECKDGKLTVSPESDCSTVYYTSDGCREPVVADAKYDSVIKTSKPQLYRFRSFYKTGRSPIVADKSFYKLATPSFTLSTSMGESGRIPYSNAEGYKTFARTKRACRQSDWILYTFAQPVKCREMTFQTGHSQLPKTIVTTGDVMVSYDGSSFVKYGELLMGSATVCPDRPVKAVKIVSTCNDNGCEFVTIQYPRIKL